MKDSKYIDHTLLKAFSTEDQILKLCEEAVQYDFKSVCVNPTWVSTAKKVLYKTGVLVCTVIGFPLGANTVEVKAHETVDAIANGADEIDMVINIGRAKMHDYDYIENEVKTVVNAANGVLVKVIIETCYLTDEEKVEVCKRCVAAGADFVKTSTGFGTGGANLHDVELMYNTVNPHCLVKASGGVKTKEDFEAMKKVGAMRIGTSNGTKLCGEESEENGELSNSSY